MQQKIKKNQKNTRQTAQGGLTGIFLFLLKTYSYWQTIPMKALLEPQPVHPQP